MYFWNPKFIFKSCLLPTLKVCCAVLKPTSVTWKITAECTANYASLCSFKLPSQLSPTLLSVLQKMALKLSSVGVIRLNFWGKFAPAFDKLDWEIKQSWFKSKSTLEVAVVSGVCWLNGDCNNFSCWVLVHYCKCEL